MFKTYKGNKNYTENLISKYLNTVVSESGRLVESRIGTGEDEIIPLCINEVINELEAVFVDIVFLLFLFPLTLFLSSGDDDVIEIAI
jgi:hypothetical protein